MALNVKPGKKRPGEKIMQPMISALAAMIAARIGPYIAANKAMGKKPKLMRINGVSTAKICVKIITKAVKIPVETNGFVVEYVTIEHLRMNFVMRCYISRGLLFYAAAGCSGCTASFRNFSFRCQLPVHLTLNAQTLTLLTIC